MECGRPQDGAGHGRCGMGRLETGTEGGRFPLAEALILPQKAAGCGSGRRRAGRRARGVGRSSR